MGLLQNGNRDICGVLKVYGLGVLNGAVPSAHHRNFHLTGSQRNITAGEGITNDKVGVPLGNLAPSAWILPQKPGMLSSRLIGVSISTSANGLMGLPGTGSSDFAITSTAEILPEDDTPQVGAGTASFSIAVADMTGQLITSGTGSSTITIATNMPLLTASIDGTGTASISITTNAPLLGALANGIGDTTFAFSSTAEILPEDDAEQVGAGTALLSFAGSLVTYAIGIMAGTTEDTGELTPSAIAAQVWTSSAFTFNDAGTMGERLNDAGSASNPWAEVLPGSYGPGTAGRIIGDAPTGEAPTVEQIRAEIDLNSTRLATISEAIEFIKGIEGGKWIIENDQMIFFKSDNITEVARFNLFDAAGNPAMTNVMSRERV